MTSVFSSKPFSDGREEKYQTRTAKLISPTEFCITVGDDNPGKVRVNSLVWLQYPIEGPENIKPLFRPNITENTLSVWLRLGPHDGPFQQRSERPPYGECFVLPRSLIEIPSKIQQLMEYGPTKADAIRLLSETDDDVDLALEKWWQNMNTRCDDPFATDSEEDPIESSSDDEPIESDSWEEDFEIPPEMIVQLVNLGFSKEDAEIAITASDFDLVAAVQLLTSGELAGKTPEKHVASCQCDSCACPYDEELVARILTVSEDQETGSVNYTTDEEILKIIWSVSKYQLDEWLQTAYDDKNQVLVFYLKCCEYTQKIQKKGSNINIQLNIFTENTPKQKMAYYGIYTSYREAIDGTKQKEKLKKDYVLAREAAGNLKPEGGGEFKNSWESQGPTLIFDHHNIKTALEMKIRDVSARAARARLKGVPEPRVRRFIDAAMVYINDQIKASGYVQRTRRRLRRQTSDGSQHFRGRLFRQRTT